MKTTPEELPEELPSGWGRTGGKPNMPPLPIEAGATVRRNARLFEGFAFLLAALAVLLFVGGIISVREGDEGPTIFYVAGACLGLALWLYLVAQIVHIRANTEK